MAGYFPVKPKHMKSENGIINGYPSEYPHIFNT